MNKIIKRAIIRLEIGYTYFGFFQTIDKYNLNELYFCFFQTFQD